MPATTISMSYWYREVLKIKKSKRYINSPFDEYDINVSTLLDHIVDVNSYNHSKRDGHSQYHSTEQFNNVEKIVYVIHL